MLWRGGNGKYGCVMVGGAVIGSMLPIVVGSTSTTITRSSLIMCMCMW